MHQALAPMAAYRQWICWQAIARPDKPGKFDKVPTDPRTGAKVNPLHPNSWMLCSEAFDAARASNGVYGVGFVFTERDPFFFLDLDDCVTQDGQASDLAAALLQRLTGAAVEYSFSGQGLHVFGRCAGDFAHAKKNVPLGIELYRDKRFAAIGSAATGGWATGSADFDCSATLPPLAEEYFPGADFDLVGWSDGPVGEYRSALDDKRLIEAACRQVSSKEFAHESVTFADLWEANEEKLGAQWPSDKGEAFDASSADYSLFSRLCFWTGKDCERMLRLAKKSALVREKWDREDYLRGSILRAVSSYFGDVLGQNRQAVAPPPTVGLPSVPAPPNGTTPEVITMEEHDRKTGAQIFFPDEQEKYFAGCVALPSMNRVYVPGYGVITSGGFRSIYDGPSFVMGYAQGSKTIRNSWEAFTGCEVNPTPLAHGVCFRPGEPALLEERGERLVNSWWEVPIERAPGDPSPFIEHVQRMLPDGDDAGIFLSYLAACVQYPGEKFAWCPVLQGVEGNGKSTLARCVELAIGERYVHQGSASQFKKDFNAWIEGNILVIVDDIKITRDRVDTMERIKPIITGERISVERKGVDAVSRSVCCNFWLNTNHQDALPITKNSRRFAVFFCAQQEESHLARDGMTSAYFAKLRRWLRDEGGYAIVAEWLHTVPIPAQWNPSSEGECGRAPATTSSTAAVVASLPPQVQHIQEAIAEGQIGFMDGWVSSIRLRDMLAERRVFLHPRKFGKYLSALGYVMHPSLPRGRSTRAIAQEGGRPTLYLREGHAVLLNEKDPARVVDHYCRAQDYMPALPKAKKTS